MLAAALSAHASAAVGLAQSAAPVDLEGVWQAKRRFGPAVYGTLTVDRQAGEWRAAIAGRAASVRVAGDSVSFAVPDGGRFTGRLGGTKRAIIGTWVQEASRTALPLTLSSCGTDCYRGTVSALEDELTFYLKVARRPDGSFGAFLRNPERNFGALNLRVARIEAAGSSVRWLDRRDSPVVAGTLRDDIMSVFLPVRGGASYDFRRIADTAFTFFYPSGRPSATYTYTPPRGRDDGWPVGTLKDVGIAPDSINALMQRITNTVIDSAHTLQTHAVLIARHGKLVLEEYFYGEHADKPHNTRSASKSVLSALLGAAMHAGVRISPQARVYATMRPGATNIDKRKEAMTLEHLLTMSAGLDCDDSGEERPGNEDNLTQDETKPDWYRAILDLDMIRDPGAKAVYCSIEPHLAGGVLARVAGRSLHDMMRDLLLEPLGIAPYYMTLSPLGDVYFGGGHALRARDFLKFGQLYLNGGTWRGRRIMSQDWVRQSITPRYTIGRANYLNYGYLWWSREYSYRDRTVRVYSALGNGGQVVMFIPELDLVIAANGGNYSDPTTVLMTNELIPRYILPAVLPEK